MNAISPTNAIRQSLDILAKRATEYAINDRAANTNRLYATYWNQFASWCADHALNPLPAQPETVALYLTDHAKMHSVSTLRVALAAISRQHKTRGFESPTSHRTPQAVWDGIKREKTARRDFAKKPMLLEHVKAATRTCDTGDTASVRNKALLLFGFASAMRRSEIVALNVGDLSFSDKGVIVAIRQSKTDQDGEGQHLAIPFGSDPAFCPVRALQSWLGVRGTPSADAPLFVALNNGGLTQNRLGARMVAITVQKAAKALGLSAGQYGGHSLRSGFITSAALKGVNLPNIMNHSRHTSVDTARRYVREAELFQNNVAGALF